MKASLVILLFVSSVSVARCQGQVQSVDQTQRQIQPLAPATTDTQSSNALHDVITKPEPSLQKWSPGPDLSRKSLYDCREYPHHFLNIHFRDHAFDTRCKSDSVGEILPYKYGPSKLKFWGTFAVAGATMVAGTELYERTIYKPSIGRAQAYSIGTSGLSTIIALSWPRLRPRYRENHYMLYSAAYVAAYVGIIVPTILIGRH